MDVSVVIINYNTYDLTVQCIASIKKHTKDIDYEIILVDNASDYFPEETFCQQFPDVKLIKSPINLGFAGGNNLGVYYARGKYVLLLNSDTYLFENSIAMAFRYMEENPRAGVMSAKLIFPDGRHQPVAQRFPRAGYLLLELLRLQKLFPRHISGKLLLGPFFDHSETAKADWVWGTFFFFRKDIIKQLPGKKLDEQYFMYYEDMQWCWDFRKLGYEVHYYAKTALVHLMGGSSANKVSLMKRNKQLFLKRNYGQLEKTLILKLEKLLGLS
jgi:GT2 family glycosyltransferase